MHKFAAAFSSEEADPIHDVLDDEAVGDDDDIEEQIYDIDCDTAAVMKERVATSTRDGYERSNINFIIWFFDNLEEYPNLLEPTIVIQMEAARAKNIQRRTKNGQPSESRESICATFRKVLR